jgi:hypothetical protein
MSILVLKQLNKRKNETMTKQEMIDFIYRYACPEYKGMLNNKPSYLKFIPGQGTSIVLLEDFEENELQELYTFAVNRKQKLSLA